MAPGTALWPKGRKRMNRRNFVASTLVAALTPAETALANDEGSAEVEAAKRTIVDWYRAFADPGVDRGHYSAFMTDDYLLLENGELLDKAGDLALRDSLPADLTRTDRFDFRRVTVNGDRADLVYFLASDLDDATDGPRHRRWLESAVLRREGGEWRCALLHSTRIGPPPPS